MTVPDEELLLPDACQCSIEHFRASDRLVGSDHFIAVEGATIRPQELQCGSMLLLAGDLEVLDHPGIIVAGGWHL